VKSRTMIILGGVALAYFWSRKAGAATQGAGLKGTPSGSTGPKQGTSEGGGATSSPGFQSGGRPDGNPPGGCVKVTASPLIVVELLNALGYWPRPDVFGPDGKLGTYDGTPDPEVMAFQTNYNEASRMKFSGPDSGGLDEDGLMGKCTFAGMDYVIGGVGPTAWRERYRSDA